MLLANRKNKSEIFTKEEKELLLTYRAASPDTFTEATAIRAQARLEQIKAFDPSPADVSRGTLRQRALRNAQLSRRQLAWRLTAIPVAAAAIIGANLANPQGVGVQSAFASWTATPSDLSGEQLELATNACLTVGGESAASIRFATSDWNPRTPQLVEGRGDWAMVFFDNGILAGEAGAQDGTCLVQFVGNAPRVAWLQAQFTDDTGDTVGFGTSGRAYGEFGFDLETQRNSRAFAWIGADFGPPPTGTVVAITGLDGTLGAEGYQLLRGRVADDIAGVVVHTPNNGDIVATVSGGHFVAWWPRSGGLAGSFAEGSVGSTGSTGSIGSPGSAGEVAQRNSFGAQSFANSVTITLKDGTVLTNQPIFLPDHDSPTGLLPIGG